MDSTARAHQAHVDAPQGGELRRAAGLQQRGRARLAAAQPAEGLRMGRKPGIPARCTRCKMHRRRVSSGQRMERHCQDAILMCWALCEQPPTAAPAHQSDRSVVLCTYLQALAADGNDPALVAVNWNGLFHSHKCCCRHREHRVLCTRPDTLRMSSARYSSVAHRSTPGMASRTSSAPRM